MRLAPSSVIIGLFLSVSCVETIVMDPETENLPVVVNCTLQGGHVSALTTSGGCQHLDLFYAKGKKAGAFVPVEEAEVYLTDGSGNVIVQFAHSSGTRWESEPVILRPGHTYTLYVKISGRETVSGRTTIPYEFEANSVWGIALVRDTNDSLDGSIDFSVPASHPHHLWIYAHKDGPHAKEETDDDLYEYLVTDNAYADDFNIVGRRFSDLDFSGTPGAAFKDYWRRLRRMQSWKPDLPLHRGFLRIDLPANYSNGRTNEEKEEYGSSENQFILVCGPQECPLEDDWRHVSRRDHYDFYSYSDEYDQYLRDVYTRKGKIGHDLTVLYSTANVYSNVTNGMGVVGSYIFREVRFVR